MHLAASLQTAISIAHLPVGNISNNHAENPSLTTSTSHVAACEDTTAHINLAHKRKTRAPKYCGDKRPY